MNAGFKGIRVFANRRDGFAIADLHQAGDGTYPVATTDGGRIPGRPDRGRAGTVERSGRPGLSIVGLPVG